MKLRFLLPLFALSLFGAERIPLVANFQDSASYRWLNKKVLDSRVLDDMRSLDKWQSFTTGPAMIIDARIPSQDTPKSASIAKISLTKEHALDGRQSLRVSIPVRVNQPGPKTGRGWGEAGVWRNFDGEDWRKFNRISVWIRPEWEGAYVVALEAIRIRNDGVEKLPAPFGQEGENTLVLRNHEWNHVVWEIENVARDKVTGLQFSYEVDGNEPEAGDTFTFDLSRLELERVEPDYVEGWGVWPGRIAYSHTGYQSGATKRAIASGLTAKEFRLIDQATGETVLKKPVQTVKTHIGTFQVMDFSEVRQAGSYAIDVGGTATRPFRIDPNVWRDTIWKALNFFYAERCGMEIPGVHGVCHRDWTATRNGKTLVVNGGWHDAGDLTQGMGGTGDITYSMFSLAERLRARGEDSELYARLIEEGRWGLEWILKTRFGDGYRGSGSVNGRRTNGILGDFDDVISTPNNTPSVNLVASAAEAIAARVLKDSDPRLAAYALRAAIEDWDFALDAIAKTDPQASKERYRGTFDSANVEHETASQAVIAAVELFRATGDQRFADKAAGMARMILDSQQRTRPNWTVPMLGFFYTGPSKDRVLHYVHNGRENLPAVALRRLCDTLPQHPDWMKWYSAVVLHSDYLKAGAKYTEPYGMLTSSIYNDQEYKEVPETRRESFRKQVLNGIPLGAGNYLRLFPVWMDYRGNHGAVLAQTQVLANAAHLRGDLGAAQLSQSQLEWVIGRNPFSQSTMWGVGYDFPPLYTPMSGDIVGGLPVGIQTRGDSDVPYWPVQNTWTYKEIWQYPVARWMFLMRDLAGPALVEGQANGAVVFREASSGAATEAQPDPATGRFRTMLPEGKYTVRSANEEVTRTFLPGGSYNLDLRPGRALDFEVSAQKNASGEVTLTLNARGSGTHRFSVRADNLKLGASPVEVALKPGTPGKAVWRASIVAPDTPWVAVVVADDDLSMRREVTGAAWDAEPRS